MSVAASDQIEQIDDGLRNVAATGLKGERSVKSVTICAFAVRREAGPVRQV